MNRTFTLTTEQLLTHWRRHRLYEPVAPGGAELSLTLSPGTEACMAARLECAYARAVSEAPADEMPLTDIASRLTLAVSTDGAARTELPRGVLRIVSVECSGWYAPARIATPADTTLIARQTNIYSRGTPWQPVAIVYPQHMLLYGCTAADTVSRCMAVVAPEPDSGFTLTPALLARICSYDL